MRTILALTLALLSTPAFADAVTWSGTLGKSNIVVELTEPSDGAVAGRYAYLSQGADIPLQPRSAEGGAWILAEEAPCGENDCIANDDGVVTDPPIGAIWSVTLSADGETLTGTWTSEADGKSLPIALKREGARTLNELATPFGLHDRAAAMSYDQSIALTMDSAPYDVMRLDGPLTFGPDIDMGGSTWMTITDTRIPLSFPRVTELADGTETGPINDALDERYRRMLLAALDCRSFVYGGFGRSNVMSGAGGSFGGYEDEEVTVTYLSPTVMSWREDGSLYCVAAHPYNHSNSFNYDVQTGQPLDLSRVFSGWVPYAWSGKPGKPADPAEARANPDDYRWGPDRALADWVRDQYVPSDDAAYEAECDFPALIPEYLAIRFEPGDKAVFAVENLPHAMMACSLDLVTVPLADIPELLAPEARDLFPSLR